MRSEEYFDRKLYIKERETNIARYQDKVRNNERIPSFEELVEPLPLHSPKRWYYGAVSLLLQTISTFSEGIKIGYTHGFDSGMIMNYIYENEPHGKLYIGRLIDKAFLNQITCKAFRAVKQITQNVLIDYLEERKNKPTFIVDLASGKADYIYDVLRDGQYKDVKVLLRDIDRVALEESKGIAEKRGLLKQIRFEQGDALDVECLKSIPLNPNLVIEIGLYGIIHDDDLIRRHLCDLREFLNPEALLFNVQTYNPQIELIARALKNRDGERCVWHLRSAEQIVKWAEQAGFKEPKVTMDPYGVYAVVMMRN
ncbi:MAG TPA: class I SAM-dependent methyltransferase family protein [Thermodesulfobacteriota bacterium]|nr:class I SAM-dependent methyltransferase family protein [Thermodesulfobacteriota bacterium]